MKLLAKLLKLCFCYTVNGKANVVKLPTITVYLRLVFTIIYLFER